MCRNIKTLFNFDPPATDEEVRAAVPQFVHKLSGFNTPSKVNETAFGAMRSRRCSKWPAALSTGWRRPPHRATERRNREGETARGRAIWAAGFGLRSSDRRPREIGVMCERLSDLLHADPTVTPAAHVPDGEQGHGSLFYVVQAVLRSTHGGVRSVNRGEVNCAYGSRLGTCDRRAFNRDTQTARLGR